MLLLSKSIALERSQQTSFPAPLFFSPTNSHPHLNHRILSTASSTASHTHLESAIRRTQPHFLQLAQSNSIFWLTCSWGHLESDSSQKKLRRFLCHAWKFWVKLLGRHCVLPTALPSKANFGEVSYKWTYSYIPVTKPHDSAVLAVISTAHLTDNWICCLTCCLLYLPHSN